MVRDKYRIDAFIATGSMANVYAATHRNGSRVALKILHRELARDPSMTERFRREGYFANAIGHPGVVRAIDDDLTEDGCAFIVMELLEGENLDDRRRRMGGRLPLGDVLQIADAMLDVLAAAHDHEVLHRDLKPENVFITRKNEVKLLDFGVARFNDGRSSSDMTGVGMVLGTPAFMPPEQALGRREEVDARSDIWSVGATLFTVLTGESVHVGGDAKTKLIATARTPARPLRDVMPEVPRAVAQVIDRALAFDKIERWADASAMREALRWARLAFHEQAADAVDRPTLEAIAQPATRRVNDEPTLAGRPRSEAHEETTARRAPVPRRKPVSVDGVYTSAPPVGQRDDPDSTGEPTFARHKDPDLSLRRKTPSETPAGRAARSEPPPSTERIPPQDDFHRRHRSELPTAELPRLGAEGSSLADRPTAPGVPDIFRKALEQTTGGTDLVTVPRFGPNAAGMPGILPAPEGTSLSIRTSPGLGGPAPTPQNVGSTTAAMPSAPPAIIHSSPPPSYSSPPEHLPEYPSLSSVHAIATSSAPRTPRGRPSLTPETPGPLLATIVPKRSNGAFRVLVPIVIGIMAGTATYVVVLRHHAANASDPTPVASPATASSPRAVLSQSPSNSAIAPGSSSASVAASGSASATARAALDVASAAEAATSVTKPRVRPKPKPKPLGVSTTGSGSTIEPPTADPLPPPGPEPAPTPSDTLPRKEE